MGYRWLGGFFQPAATFINKIKYKAMPILLIGLQLKAPGLDIAGKIKNHSQIGTVTRRTADALYRTACQVKFRKVRFQSGVFQINHQARRVSQGEHVVIDLALGIQYQAGMIWRRPDADPLNFSASVSRHGYRQQPQCHQGHQGCHCFHCQLESFHTACLFIRFRPINGPARSVPVHSKVTRPIQNAPGQLPNGLRPDVQGGFRDPVAAKALHHVRAIQ